MTRESRDVRKSQPVTNSKNERGTRGATWILRKRERGLRFVKFRDRTQV